MLVCALPCQRWFHSHSIINSRYKYLILLDFTGDYFNDAIRCTSGRKCCISNDKPAYWHLFYRRTGMGAIVVCFVLFRKISV